MGTTIMQKTGQIERTVDREFAEEEGRYRVCVFVPIPMIYCVLLFGIPAYPP